MLLVFRIDGAKVDRDVAFVAMVCTCMLKASVTNASSIFQTYVASVFIWMLHMFHTYDASVLSGYCVCLQCFQLFSGVFQVFQTYVASVSAISDVCCMCFIWMLQK